MSPNNNTTDSGGDNQIADIRYYLSLELAALGHFMSVHNDALTEIDVKRRAGQQIIASLTCLDIESSLIASSLAYLKATASAQFDVTLQDTVASLERSRDNVRAAIHDLQQVLLTAQQQAASPTPLQAAATTEHEITVVTPSKVIASLARARAAFQQHEKELSFAKINIAAHQIQDIHVLVAAIALLVAHNHDVITTLKEKAQLLVASTSRRTTDTASTPVPSVVTIPTNARRSSTNSDAPQLFEELSLDDYDVEEVETKTEQGNRKLRASVGSSTAPTPSADIAPDNPGKSERNRGRRRSKKHTEKNGISSVMDDPLANGISFANLTLDDDCTSDDENQKSVSKKDAMSDRKLPAAASSKKRVRNRGRRRGNQHSSSRSSSAANNSLPAGVDNDPSPVIVASEDSPPLIDSIHVDPPPSKLEKPIVLPIDEHKDEILRTVKNQRVTIIHGETGCGKSSRVPCFLLRAALPDPTSRAREPKMMISQPRRIAAKALAERVRSCEPDLADKIGLRMGHGIREHETSKTRAWFVTTGYLVRVLANNPTWFDSHTHLIIDEVHERSIDTDILCLLCRRLLHSHPTIRLVLMSATMAAELYGQYFGVPQPPIFVGARRFPIKEFFVEDLTSSVLASAGSKNAKLVQDVLAECEKSKCKSAPSSVNMDKLYRLATEITASVGNHGSLLIFVPGMNDIESIIELIEKLNIPGISFLCLPIHSDVPFEDQLAVFEAPKAGEVKVIIATNAAESSLTLPDCDHVICLGLCKQITYDSASHRQMLVPTWISKASATQRAGRTGRVREGNVYRLYSRKAFEQYMEPFEKGEIVRSPLDSTILSLRDMLNEPVTPILLECLEPPDMSTIERSFESLYDSNFITHPSDEGVITSMGSLVVALGIDLTLGNFVGLGIKFGVAAEAIQLAAILSFPQSPWAFSNPLYHDVDTFNDITSKAFVSRCFFDASLFSEPMAVLNLLHGYAHCKDRNKFIWKHCVSGSRVKHLYGTVQSLKQRVAEHLKIDSELLEVESLPLNHTKVNILRILQVWIFYDTIIVQSPSKCANESATDGEFSINLVGPPIGRQHLCQILDEQRHMFEIRNTGQIRMQGSFPSTLGEFDERIFDARFASHALEKKIDISSYLRQSTHTFFVLEDVWNQTEDELTEMGNALMTVDEIVFQQSSGGNKRGIRGRACGAWQLTSDGGAAAAGNDETQTKRVFILTCFLSDLKKRKALERFIEYNYLAKPASSSIFCSITESRTKTSFSLSFDGGCHGVSKTDLCDMFAAPDLVASTSGSIQQRINFPRLENNPETNDLSHGHPLFVDAPEGARLMTVLASTRRKENFIRFNDGNEGSDDQFIDVVLPKTLSINGRKWKRKDGRGMVYLQSNCVPAAALPTHNDLELFGCCANTLELSGGACRVEGITLLPQGRMFVGLALLAFGIGPRTGISHAKSMEFSEYDDDDEEYMEDFVNSIIDDAWGWIKERDQFADLSVRCRIGEALQFHSDYLVLGETMECQPEMIKNLCALFDMVDGHPMDIWNVETLASLRTKSRARKTARDIPITDRDKQRHATSTQLNDSKEERPIIPSSLITSKKKGSAKSSAAAAAKSTKYMK